MEGIELENYYDDSEIKEYAYYGKNLSVVNLREGTVKVEVGAYAKNDIKELSTPSNLTVIEDVAFCENEKLSDVSLNEGLRIIGKWAFYGCNIGNITIPSTVEVIGRGAFINNPLTRVYLYEDCYISYLDDNALREIFGSAMIIRLPKKVMSLKR